MQLSIWSHWQGRSWSGEIPAPELDAAELPLEWVFRYFNRVDDGDHDRLLGIGYDLPSLSEGDVVTLAGTTPDGRALRFRCDSFGWTLLEDDEQPETSEQHERASR
jgi:hypothetical protein